MRKVVIIQARMTSTRLPGKVLVDIGGKPMLAQQIRRLQMCQLVDDIVIATTINPEDKPIVDLADNCGISCFRGSELDVLQRFRDAARFSQAEVVIRVTADCPLIDPEVTDKVIKTLITQNCDYASNIIERSYPRGLDVEAFHYDVLMRLDRLAISPAAREHVTVFAYSERADLFLRTSVTDNEDNSDLRWTVDTKIDLELIRHIYDALHLANIHLSYREILAYIRQMPYFAQLNQGTKTWTPPPPTFS